MQQPRILSSIYSTVHVNEKQQEQKFFMEFHSRHPNSHGFVGVSCEYTTIDSHYPQPLCTILYYYGTHYNGTLRCIACVRSYAEHCFVQWPVACLAPSHFSKPCCLLWPIVIKIYGAGSDSGLSPVWCQAIIWISAGSSVKSKSSNDKFHRGR